MSSRRGLEPSDVWFPVGPLECRHPERGRPLGRRTSIGCRDRDVERRPVGRLRLRRDRPPSRTSASREITSRALGAFGGVDASHRPNQGSRDWRRARTNPAHRHPSRFGDCHGSNRAADPLSGGEWQSLWRSTCRRLELVASRWGPQAQPHRSMDSCRTESIGRCCDVDGASRAGRRPCDFHRLRDGGCAFAERSEQVRTCEMRASDFQTPRERAPRWELMGASSPTDS